ncbi:ABC transporter ATP-binding protein [Microbacterium sp. SZ1]|uniref:ABC transporter ATP-binding protein n=1 Tax=Microbacterium sp. SZ1 TaxID=1849736 RepID=UPI000BD5786E|nr:ABC transporter ATP-binding protein [Microbacterium sp. SZ1]PCE13853.1 ABC transporter ATP-binding protein [Microbacterium sp. SZ1]
MSAPHAGLRARVVVPREHFVVDVALQVGAGETVAIMGPSGAGKSTLLQALAGFVPLGDGEIEVGGRVVDRATRPRVRTEPMRRGIVLLGQNPRLFPHLSARENVAFGPRAAGISAAEARRDADDWLARVGLPGAGDRRTQELSGGEAQRVAVARALAAAPRVVLLDEPLVALDPDTAGDIRRMLREQLADTTTVAVTHDASDAVALADRLVVIEAGRMTQQGEVREVLAAPASAFVASIAGANRIEGVARGGGWSRADVRLVAGDAASQALATVDGAALAAVFRPGDVHVVTGAGGVNSWRAVVTRIEPTLAGVRVLTDLGAVDLSLQDAGALRSGDALTLHVTPEHVRFVAAS